MEKEKTRRNTLNWIGIRSISITEGYGNKYRYKTHTEPNSGLEQHLPTTHTPIAMSTTLQKLASKHHSPLKGIKDSLSKWLIPKLV